MGGGRAEKARRKRGRRVDKESKEERMSEKHGLKREGERKGNSRRRK